MKIGDMLNITMKTPLGYLDPQKVADAFDKLKAENERLRQQLAYENMASDVREYSS